MFVPRRHTETGHDSGLDDVLEVVSPSAPQSCRQHSQVAARFRYQCVAAAKDKKDIAQVFLNVPPLPIHCRIPQKTSC